MNEIWTPWTYRSGASKNSETKNLISPARLRSRYWRTRSNNFFKHPLRQILSMKGRELARLMSIIFGPLQRRTANRCSRSADDKDGRVWAYHGRDKLKRRRC